MKLKYIKSALLGLFLINSLTACKFNGEFSQLEDGTIIGQVNLQEEAVYSEIIEARSLDKSTIELKLLTEDVRGEYNASLEDMRCTKSIPAKCFARLETSGIDVSNTEQLVNRTVTIKVDQHNMGALSIVDDSDSLKLVEFKSEVILGGVTLDKVEVEPRNGTFTVYASHPHCQPGSIDLELADQYYNERPKVTDQEMVNSSKGLVEAPSDELIAISPYPHPKRYAKLIFRTNPTDDPIFCPAVVGYRLHSKKTFSFADLGIEQGQSLTITDAIGRQEIVTNNVSVNLKRIANIYDAQVDLKSSKLNLKVGTPGNYEVKMDGCTSDIDDRVRREDILRTCKATFVQHYYHNEIVPQVVTTISFDLHEVGLGQNARKLILRDGQGFYEITISAGGEVDIQRAMYAILNAAGE